MPFGYIYKIEFPNGKVYIGQTSRTLEQRKKEHYRDAKNGNTRYVYNELRYYNMVNTFELIEIDTADNKEELDEKEIGYILIYRSSEREYGCNGTIGGEGTNGYVFTEEDRKKMSESQKKRMENPEEKERLAESSRNFWNNNEDAKQKMSEIKKEQCNNIEWRNSQSERIKKVHEDNPDLAKQHGEKMKTMHKDNPDIAKQHSERQKKRMESPEVRKQMSEIGKQYYEKTQGAREENSKRQKKRFERQSERDKLSEIHKKRLENPEIRKQISETGKQYYKEHPERLEQMSKIGKELWKTTEHRIKMLNARGLNKPFDMFKKDGTFIKTFTYQFEAKEYLKNELNITLTIAVGLFKFVQWICI